MSGADYAHCDGCGNKAFYDADNPIPEDVAVFHAACLTEHGAEVRADERARVKALVSTLHRNVERWHVDLPRDVADSRIREHLRDLRALLDPTITTEGADDE